MCHQIHRHTLDLTDGSPTALNALDPILSRLVQRFKEQLEGASKADALLEMVRIGFVRVP